MLSRARMKDRATRVTADLKAFVEGYYRAVVKRLCPGAFEGTRYLKTKADIRIPGIGEQEMRLMVLRALALATPEDLVAARREYRKAQKYIRGEVKRLSAVWKQPEGEGLHELGEVDSSEREAS